MPEERILSLNQTDRLLAGFILHKLWSLRYWCAGGGGHHLGHTALSNLPKGRARSDAGNICSIAKKLQKWGFISIFPSTGEKHVCASRSAQIIDQGLILVNEYRSSVQLPPLLKTEI
jgi:hypothetical protein